MTELELESGVRSPELESGVGDEEEEADEDEEEEEGTAFDRVVVPWSDGKDKLFAELIVKTHPACAGKTNVAMETLLAAEFGLHPQLTMLHKLLQPL
ncbi:hypothetical protein V8C86DRAFT_3135764 [Haematococcus lacustris]